MAYWDARHQGERVGLALQPPATIKQAEAILNALQRCGPTIPARTGEGRASRSTGGFVADILPVHDN